MAAPSFHVCKIDRYSRVRKQSANASDRSIESILLKKAFHTQHKGDLRFWRDECPLLLCERHLLDLSDFAYRGTRQGAMLSQGR